MAWMCREFGISRKTGYKIFERYEQCGLEGLSDRARRPFRYANQLPEQVEGAIVAAKREKPHAVLDRHVFPTACGRMTCGAPTARASSSSATSATAIRSPSLITLRAILTPVRSPGIESRRTGFAGL
jgi:hypothetical protein